MSLTVSFFSFLSFSNNSDPGYGVNVENNIFEQRIFEYYLRYKLNKQAKEQSSLRRPYPNI